MPAIQDAQGHISQPALLAILVVLPAAMATLIGGLLSGVATLLSQKEQRAAALALETRKGEILVDLDRKRNELTEDLDKKRNALAEQLETKKNEHLKSLEDHKTDLSVKRATIDDAVAQLKDARDTLTLYRQSIGALRFGTFSAEEVKPLEQRLALCRDRLDRGGKLYQSWVEFMQQGLYLKESARGKKPREQTRLWISPSLLPEHGGRALGVVFGGMAENTISLLDEEVARAREG
jgi:hypothetical protein